MRITRLAGAVTAGTLLAACDNPDALSLEPAAPRATISAEKGTADSAALARAGITWKVVQAVQPASPTLAVGATVRLETVVKFNDGTVRNPSSVKWSSSDTTVAPITPSGTVTGRRAGTVVLTAALNWRSLMHRDSVRLTIGDGSAVASAPAADTTAVDAAGKTAAVKPEGGPVAEPTAVASTAAAPALPRATVDTRMPVQTGRTISVKAGDNLQAALDQAQPGDVVELANGATYAGAFRLRAKKGTGWIVIRPASEAGIPRPGTRVSPANSAAMPKLVMTGDNVGAIRADAGAGYYRFVGIEFSAAERWRDFNTIVRLHVDEMTSVAQMPHHFVFDRVYIHALPEQGVSRCLLMNSTWTAVIDSYLSECHAKGRDSQAIASWSGAGPFKIENNYLEGAGENVMFGGAASAFAGAIPSDIEIRGNHLAKPLAWLASGRWTVKNLFELKQAQRVLVENNVFENNWVDAQTGRAILIRAADQTSKSPWARTTDITFRYNIVRHTASGVSIDAQGPEETTRRVLISQNLFYDVGDRALGSGGMLFQLTGGLPMQDIVLDHNTALFSTGSNVSRRYAVMFDGGAHQGIGLTNNVMELGKYGVLGSGATEGVPSLARYAPNAVVGGNMFVGDAKAAAYTARNTVVASLAQLGLSGIGANGTDAVAAVGAMRTATGPVRAGANVGDILRRTAGVVR